MRIVLASPRAGGLGEFVHGLEESGAEVAACPDGETALAEIRSARPDLVVVDEDLPDLEPGRMIIAVLQVDVGIATAVMSPLSDEEFHERTEGLGILARIPPRPGRADAAALLATWRGLTGS